MDDHLETFLSAQREFGARVNAITEDQWQSATPDTEWSVADLVSHLVEEHRYAAPLMDGHDLESARMIAEGARSMPVDGGVGGNYAEEWNAAAIGSGDAFSADGALDRTVQLSSGERPARDYIEEMILDLVVHAWDLGTAIGYSQPLPDDIVAAALEKAETFGDLSGSGVFEAAVSVPDDAPAIDRLVARTGRDPEAVTALPEPDDFAQLVLHAVESIPRGRVMTYGDVAEYVGIKSPRTVGQVLAADNGSVPWHRVMRSDGTLAEHLYTEQRQRLLEEGVRFRDPDGDRVDLVNYRWDGVSTSAE